MAKMYPRKNDIEPQILTKPLISNQARTHINGNARTNPTINRYNHYHIISHVWKLDSMASCTCHAIETSLYRGTLKLKNVPVCNVSTTCPLSRRCVCSSRNLRRTPQIWVGSVSVTRSTRCLPSGSGAKGKSRRQL